MNKLFGTLVAQFKEFYKNLSPVKRTSILASAFVVFIAVAVVLSILSGASNEVLFQNVSPEHLPLVVEKLQAKNIPFTLRDGGKTVEVPSDLLPVTQMTLMSELGDTKIGGKGLELFEKQDFGMTSYAQRVNYQRALQFELMRAINTLSAVKQSKVLLALPPKKTFLEEGGKPKASVVLEFHPGKSLTPDQVKGISYLVASSVEELEADDVTVVDSRGKILSRNYSTESGLSAELLDIKKKRELEIEDKIETILSKVVGNGKVVAKVDVELESQNVDTVQESVDADNTALESQTAESEMLDGARTNPVGVPGARANLPGAEDRGEVGFKQNVTKELKTSNYTVPKTVKNIRQVAGGLKRISVAVLVDGFMKTTPADGGDVRQEWAARTPEELVKYEDVVKNAVGFSAARGDSVRIENIRFEQEDFSESEKLLSKMERDKLIHALMKWLTILVALGLFYFVVIRPFMGWITDSFQETVDDMLPRTIEELEELQSVDNTLPGMTGALPILEESIDPDKAESELLKERIMSLMEADSEKASGAFSLWLSRRDT